MNIPVGLAPVIGGAVVGAITLAIQNEFAPGIPGIIGEVAKGKKLAIEKYLAKFTAAIATLGTGNSLGPEGPSVELGLQMSRFISEKYNLTLE